MITLPCIAETAASDVCVWVSLSPACVSWPSEVVFMRNHSSKCVVTRENFLYWNNAQTQSIYVTPKHLLHNNMF